ncbi:hypothetical protein NMY22_g8340 [Coprinellus aureogranulatus]|nr:hypothetical protein NMY22_g8340 [Coprinellus aureogranulatus]
MSPIEDREFNFCYPVPDVLQNHRIKLVPFVPSVHLEPYFAASKPHPEVYKYLPWGPFPTTSSLAESIQVRFQQEPGWLLFAIFDKTTPSADGQGSLAGIMSYQYSSPVNLCTEIGAAIVLPAYQRTHVATNAVGLLLNYALNLPSHSSFPGLGLRRVVWQANFLNEASIRLGQRMGFQKEGILRWDRVLPSWKDADVGNGKDERKGDPRAGCLGRDTVMMGLCWDDWENGGRERVDAEMARMQ